ncbi:MAG TPA: (Fe-S)-binding protein [Symbiobacteriaceae bacterium]|jgi:Fe-S oxidoreductase
MTAKRVTPKDMGRMGDQPVVSYCVKDLMEIPGLESEPPIPPCSPAWKEKYDMSLDGFAAIGFPKPKTKAEEDAICARFLSGLEKLFDPENNWAFCQPLRLSYDYCMKCQTCSDACHNYVGSGRQEVYRPSYRAEVLRRLWQRYFTPEGKLLGSFVGADVELNWQTVARLAESAYRCTLCRRCSQTCPMAVDNGLITRELRKLFSQEFGMAPTEVLEKGVVQQLKTGSSTGMRPAGFRDAVEFLADDIGERIGRKIEIPIDKKGADVLLLHNAGEFLAWPENPAAFAILFNAAGINWTLSSEPMGYDGVNYGLWNDDVEYARVVIRQAQAAKQLGVKKIVVGECGHATKGMVVIADRVLTGDLSGSELGRESCLPLLAEIVKSGAIKFDPRKNDFPVTLHDPCNFARSMGIVAPQREVARAICPQFREMAPNGTQNYCCGGGSGFAICNSYNFKSWRNSVGARMKMKQIMEAFDGELDPQQYPFKYVCAPCSNCKGTLRDAIGHYGLWDKHRINYGGLVELMVNAMVDMDRPFIDREDFH